MSAGAATATTIRVMPLGDSITDGYVVPGGYRTQLWTRGVQTDGDAIDFVGSLASGPATLGDQDNEGHVSWCLDGLPCGTANDLVASIDIWLAAAQPNIILLHGGTNDISRGFTGAQTATHLDTLLGKIYTDEPGVDVIVAKIIPMGVTGTKLQAWNDYQAAIPGVVSKYSLLGDDIQMVDMSTLLTLNTADYYQSSPTAGYDPLHPSQQGYDKMADAWYPALTASYEAMEGAVTPTPTPTETPTPTPAPTETPSPSPSPTPTPTLTPMATPTPSPAPALVDYFAHCDTSVESSASCWTGVYSSTSKLTWVAVDAETGKHSIRYADAPSATAAAGLNAKPTPVTSTTRGVIYTGGVWIRASAANITVVFTLREKRGSTAPGYSLTTWKATDTKWHFLASSYAAKQSGDSLTYSIYSPSLPSGGYVDCDVFSLTSPAKV